MYDLQATLLTGDQGTRIDIQSNDAFPKELKDENNNVYTVSANRLPCKLARMSTALSVPAGEFVSAGGIRKALFTSFESSQIVYFIKAPAR